MSGIEGVGTNWRLLLTRAGSATMAVAVGGGAAFCLALALRVLAPGPGEEHASAPISVRIMNRPPRIDPAPLEPEPRSDQAPEDRSQAAPKEPAPARSQAPLPVLPALALPNPGLAGASLPLPEWPMGALSASSGGDAEQGAVEPRAVPEEPFRWIFGPPHLTAREKERYYPRHALRRGLKGEVELLVRLGPEGRVSEVSVLRSEPVGVFDAAARNLARTWRGSRADLRRATILFEPENEGW